MNEPIPVDAVVLYPPRFGAFYDDRPIDAVMQLGRAHILLAVFNGRWPSVN